MIQQDTYAISRALEARKVFVAKVYAWMCFGLLLTALVAMYISSSRELVTAIFKTPFVFMGLIIAELGLVVALTAAINRISAFAATAMFVLYAALSGVTLSIIFMVYTAESITSTFFITSVTFGSLAVYGYVTKTDLTSVGNICFMLLIGLIVASVVNIFLKAEMLYWITTYAGVAIFVGLTAYDAQKIKRMAPADQNDTENMQKGAIIGALALYLDFINLFLLLLRLFGRRR